MTRAENFIKNAKRKHGHQSTMSNSAWCDFKKKFTVLKLHDLCHNPKSNCQKQITFSLKQFQLESGSIKTELQKNLRELKLLGINFLSQQLMKQHHLLV